MSLGEPLLRLDSTDSTNRVALEWMDAPDGTCVVARTQTAGRGRLGRKWDSAPDSGLYLSLVLHRKQNRALYSLLSALGVAQAVGQLTGLQCRVKWPNDVLCVSEAGQARKIGGILGESSGARLVIGIGLNLTQSHEELPLRPLFPASSLQIETGRKWENDAVLDAILKSLDAIFTRFEAGQWEDLRRKFQRCCLGIGEIVQIKSENESLLGVFDSIGEDGALLLRNADGLRRVLAGDVSYF